MKKTIEEEEDKIFSIIRTKTNTIKAHNVSRETDLTISTQHQQTIRLPASMSPKAP